MDNELTATLPKVDPIAVAKMEKALAKKGIKTTLRPPREPVYQSSGHIRDQAKRHTADMLGVLLGIANDPKASNTARVAAATEVLSRGWGRPGQQITVGAASLSDEELRSRAAQILAKRGMTLKAWAPGALALGQGEGQGPSAEGGYAMAVAPNASVVPNASALPNDGLAPPT